MAATLGTLWVVATPIGNLHDVGGRVRTCFDSVDRLLAEDTRHTRALLTALGCNPPLESLHGFNEAQRVGRWIACLQAGQSLALVSDAGTPLVSDPGQRLVAAAHDAGVPVRPIPGPSAPVVALSVSGFSGDAFHFHGFLPAKAAARARTLAACSDDGATQVFFEAPHRLLESLHAMAQAFGEEREALLARELTKCHETVKRSPLGELVSWVANDAWQQKGECVVVVQGHPDPQAAALARGCQQLESLVGPMGAKAAAAWVATHTGLPRSALYRHALGLAD